MPRTCEVVNVRRCRGGRVVWAGVPPAACARKRGSSRRESASARWCCSAPREARCGVNASVKCRVKQVTESGEQGGGRDNAQAVPRVGKKQAECNTERAIVGGRRGSSGYQGCSRHDTMSAPRRQVPSNSKELQQTEVVFRREFVLCPANAR